MLNIYIIIACIVCTGILLILNNKFEYVEDLNLQNVVGNSYIILFTFTDEQGTVATDP